MNITYDWKDVRGYHHIFQPQKQGKCPLVQSNPVWMKPSSIFQNTKIKGPNCLILQFLSCHEHIDLKINHLVSCGSSNTTWRRQGGHFPKSQDLGQSSGFWSGPTSAHFQHTEPSCICIAGTIIISQWGEKAIGAIHRLQLSQKYWVPNSWVLVRPS